MELPENLPFQRGTAASSDGIRLNYLRVGSGAPLVVCHGALAAAQDWLPFAVQMAAIRTVYLYDRRGRGENPTVNPKFAINADVDDLAAMVRLAGPNAAVLGHSFGGSCALRFAAREEFGGSLIVYEPTHSTHRPFSRGRTHEIERLIASGDLDAATEFALINVVGMPQEAIAGFRQSRLWEPTCKTITAFPNELRFLDSMVWQAGDLDGIGGTPWLLLGTETPAGPGEATPGATLQALLPGLKTVLIPGEGHLAYLTGPAALARAVMECLPKDQT